MLPTAPSGAQTTPGRATPLNSGLVTVLDERAACPFGDGRTAECCMDDEIFIVPHCVVALIPMLTAWWSHIFVSVTATIAVIPIKWRRVRNFIAILIGELPPAW